MDRKFGLGFIVFLFLVAAEARGSKGQAVLVNGSWVEIDRLPVGSQLLNGNSGEDHRASLRDTLAEDGYSYITTGQYNIDPKMGSCEQITNKFYNFYIKELPSEHLYSDYAIACIPGSDLNYTVFELNIEPMTESNLHRQSLTRYLQSHDNHKMFGFVVDFERIASIELVKPIDFVHYLGDLTGPHDYKYTVQTPNQRVKTFGQYQEIKENERLKLQSPDIKDLYDFLSERLLPEDYPMVFDKILPKINFVQSWNTQHFILEDNSQVRSRWSIGVFRFCRKNCRILDP